MTFIGRRFLFILLMGSGLVLIRTPHLKAQDAGTTANKSQQDTNDPDYDPRKRQRSDKERYKAQKELRKELKGTYKTWLNQEVPYIISDDERKAFMTLSNDEERDAFIENFLAAPQPEPGFP